MKKVRLLGFALAALMLSASAAQAQEAVKVNFTPPAASPLLRLAPKPLTPVPQRSSWICYTAYGTCYVPYLGPCSCCFPPYGCYGGST